MSLNLFRFPCSIPVFTFDQNSGVIQVETLIPNLKTVTGRVGLKVT